MEGEHLWTSIKYRNEPSRRKKERENVPNGSDQILSDRAQDQERLEAEWDRESEKARKSERETRSRSRVRPGRV